MGQSCLVGWWSIDTANIKICFFYLKFPKISSPSVYRSVCMEELMEFLIARSTPPPLEDLFCKLCNYQVEFLNFQFSCLAMLHIQI